MQEMCAHWMCTSREGHQQQDSTTCFKDMCAQHQPSDSLAMQEGGADGNKRSI